jgi:N-acetylglucosaminyldiphosphoundecaprenol N-acetyl-beta-D-mannosaminyltransferase
MSDFNIRQLKLYDQSLNGIENKKLLINTINAYSFNMSQNDAFYAEALSKSDILLPDGISIVFAVRLITGQKLKKIAGADLFAYEMKKLNSSGGSCFFLGSSVNTLNLISERARSEFPNVKVNVYSPPYKPVFTDQDNSEMLQAVNSCKPDVLFVGMTAPKQEKWAYQNFSKLEAGHICAIGAVFDFYAGTIKRAPQWMIKLGLEWFYRLIREPRRLWSRYVIGNSKFCWLVLKEKLNLKR